MSSDPGLFLKIDRIHLPIYHVYACIRALSFMFAESRLLFVIVIQYSTKWISVPCLLSLEKKTRGDLTTSDLQNLIFLNMKR